MNSPAGGGRRHEPAVRPPAQAPVRPGPRMSALPPSASPTAAEPPWWASAGHTLLDVLGLVPVLGEPADMANAAWYAAEGNYLDAGLSLISVIPVVGDVVGKGGKLAKAMGGKLGGKALDTIRTLNFPEILGKFRQNPKLGRHVDKIVEALEGWRDSLLKNFSDGAAPGLPFTCPKLLAAARRQAAELLGKAAAAEKRVTPDLEDLADSLGTRLEGLDFRLKTEDSLVRKLAETPAHEVFDALRYTMVSDAKSLGDNARKTLETLQGEGYKVIQVKNTFREGEAYKGLNTKLQSPEGQVFELQFHTPQSFDMKQNRTHAMYETFRTLPAGHPDRSRLFDAMVDLSSEIPNPPGLAGSLARWLP